jgi:hypothetical protein
MIGSKSMISRWFMLLLFLPAAVMATLAALGVRAKRFERRRPGFPVIPVDRQNRSRR